MLKVVGVLLLLLLPISNGSSRKHAAYVFLNGKGLVRGGGGDTTVQNMIDDATALVDLRGNEFAPTISVITTTPGEPGYGLDVQGLLRSIDPNNLTNEQQLKKELVEMYVRSAQGELDSAGYHVIPSALASMHANESHNATLLDGHYKDASDMTLAGFTGDMRKARGLSGSVYKDANGDGYPDGPFQIERGAPNGNEGRISKLNGKDSSVGRGFDVVYFPDQLSWVNYDFSEIMGMYSEAGRDETAVQMMLASAKHNRGSVDAQAFGIPYATKSKAGEYVNASSDETYREASVLFRDISNMYNRLRPPLGRMDNPDQTTLGVCLALKSGWYIAGDMNDMRSALRQGSAYITAVFPESSNDPVAWIADNYVKLPWEVAGMSREEYSRIYGMNTTNYEDHYNHNFLFKVESRTSSAYLQKRAGGGDPPVVHAWDFIPLGHMTASVLMGETILLQLMVEAGMPTDIDGVSIDPTNPTTAYKAFRKSNPSSYDPSATNPDMGEKFKQLLAMVGINPTPAQQMVLYSVYQNLGGKYSQPDRGKFMLGTKTPGRRWFDCSSLTAVALGLGQVSGNPPMMKYAFASGQFYSYAVGQRALSAEFEGKEYDTTMHVVSDTARHYRQFSNHPEYVSGGLQPADIFTVSTSGHTYMLLGVAKRPFTLTMDISMNGKLDADHATANVGDQITLEATSDGDYNRVNIRRWEDGRDYIVARMNVCTLQGAFCACRHKIRGLAPLTLAKTYVGKL